MKRVSVVLAALALASCGGSGRMVSAWKITLQNVEKPATCYADGNLPSHTTSTTLQTAMDWEVWVDEADKHVLIATVSVAGKEYGGAIPGTLKDGAFSFVTVSTDVTRVPDTILGKGRTETRTDTMTIAGTIKADTLTGTVKTDHVMKCDGNCSNVSIDPSCTVDYPIKGFQIVSQSVHST